MTPARRNGLAALIVLLLGAGVVAAFTVDEGEGTETANRGQATTTTATTGVPTTAAATTSTTAVPAPGSAAQATTTTTLSTTTTTRATTTTIAAATSTTAAPTHPNTGGPATLLPGLALAGAGLLGLRRGRRLE